MSYSTTKDINIEIDIFPSGGGEKGYTIYVINNTITAQIKNLGIANEKIVLTDVKKEVSSKLSANQVESIISYINHIKQYDQANKDSAYALDTWIYIVKINKQEIAKFNSLTLIENSNNEKTNIIKELTKYLIRLSPLKLDLPSFS